MRRLLASTFACVTSVFFTNCPNLLRIHLAFETKIKGIWLLSMIKESITNGHTFAGLQSKQRVAQEVSSLAIVTTSTVPLHEALDSLYGGFYMIFLARIPHAGVTSILHDTIGDLFR
jgi:solute carrier family 25 protein 16